MQALSAGSDHDLVQARTEVTDQEVTGTRIASLGLGRDGAAADEKGPGASTEYGAEPYRIAGKLTKPEKNRKGVESLVPGKWQSASLELTVTTPNGKVMQLGMELKVVVGKLQGDGKYMTEIGLALSAGGKLGGCSDAPIAGSGSGGLGTEQPAEAGAAGEAFIKGSFGGVAEGQLSISPKDVISLIFASGLVTIASGEVKVGPAKVAGKLLLDKSARRVRLEYERFKRFEGIPGLSGIPKPSFDTAPVSEDTGVAAGGQIKVTAALPAQGIANFIQFMSLGATACKPQLPGGGSRPQLPPGS